MTKQDFFDKWNRYNQCKGAWCRDASTLFWARSYNMPDDVLLEMSHDFLSIPSVASVEQKHYCSSIHLARRTLYKAVLAG